MAEYKNVSAKWQLVEASKENQVVSFAALNKAILDFSMNCGLSAKQIKKGTYGCTGRYLSEAGTKKVAYRMKEGNLIGFDSIIGDAGVYSAEDELRRIFFGEWSWRIESDLMYLEKKTSDDKSMVGLQLVFKKVL